ncbi:MAG TPA: 2-C-methyl-D-erythritol 2,4-cyclodiphosphate synthase [Candidatus Acidoferrum sp.]|nr:2-C-methyl-D-erythritol 2,4-cyclodiphosphate synthase [Candidatus Acidoferrum sp.]
MRLTRAGHGFDAHPLVEGRALVIGGVRIPFERGALGHSDADVLVHAISDALLGAACLGDLGSRFPASDDRWKDADSMLMLQNCAQALRHAGFDPVNIDATVVVDSPKLAAFISQMRANVASHTGLRLDDVSIKAKSSEGLGYTGDGSGICAYAVASVLAPDRAP